MTGAPVARPVMDPLRSAIAPLRLAVVPICLALIASCSPLTGLPPVPEDLTPADAGIDQLENWAERARRLHEPVSAEESARWAAEPPGSPLDTARRSLALWNDRSAGREALALMAEALAADPDDMVIGNGYRMLVYRMKRHYLSEAKQRGERTPDLPRFLREAPLALLQRLAAGSPGRIVRLQIALAHVDQMVLHPALEIKAPASIDSVRVLSSILEGDARHDLPALFARGLNYMHRPHDLVWPEHPAPPADAASRDIALAAAVGARVGGAPDRLRGLLLMTLGDAHAVQREVSMARSWWMLAREACDDRGILDDIARRMSWPDAETPDRMEGLLAARMADQDHPLSDLAFLWSAGSEGAP